MNSTISKASAGTITDASPKCKIDTLGNKEKSEIAVGGATLLDSGEKKSQNQMIRIVDHKFPIPNTYDTQRYGEKKNDDGDTLVDKYVSNLLLCCEGLHSSNKRLKVDNDSIEEEEKINLDRETAELLLHMPGSFLQLLSDDSLDLDSPGKAKKKNDQIKGIIHSCLNSAPLSSSQSTKHISDAPMSVRISSMFAQKKIVGANIPNNKVMRAGTSKDNPELMRVRVAESLLMLSEFDANPKCECFFFQLFI